MLYVILLPGRVDVVVAGITGSEQSSSVVLGQDEKPREEKNKKNKELLGCHPHTELG